MIPSWVGVPLNLEDESSDVGCNDERNIVNETRGGSDDTALKNSPDTLKIKPRDAPEINFPRDYTAIIVNSSSFDDDDDEDITSFADTVRINCVCPDITDIQSSSDSELKSAPDTVSEIISSDEDTTSTPDTARININSAEKASKFTDDGGHARINSSRTVTIRSKDTVIIKSSDVMESRNGHADSGKSINPLDTANIKNLPRNNDAESRSSEDQIIVNYTEKTDIRRISSESDGGSSSDTMRIISSDEEIQMVEAFPDTEISHDTDSDKVGLKNSRDTKIKYPPGLDSGNLSVHDARVAPVIPQSDSLRREIAKKAFQRVLSSSSLCPSSPSREEVSSPC